MKLINIKKLSFEYFRRDAEGNVEEKVEALKDISLDVKQGEFIAILGKNGSGKSTLAKHINALLLPGEGEVIVDGMDTLEEEVRLRIRQTAGMVFQNPDNQIVGNLVEEDIAFGPENLGIATEAIWNRVDDALDITGMEAYRNQSPNHLSGGQKQRVAIAGVLAMEPKCIIFDEATAMLDPQGRSQMIQAAKRLQEKKGITIILITHHMDEVLFADKVFVMKEGKVRGMGTPEEIFSRKELIEECGLSLPAFYQYLHYLEEEEILSHKECMEINSVQQLSRLLSKKYAGGSGKTESIAQPEVGGNLEKPVMGGKPDRIAKPIEGEKTEPATIQRRSKKPLRYDGNQSKGLRLEHVSYLYNKGFADERYALHDVSLTIEKGEFVAVIGHTGSGKSTLMQHLNGLYLPSEGKVCYNGHDITGKDFSIQHLRQKVGLVFQYPEYQLFEETVEKDICFGPENMKLSETEAKKRAYDAIKAVGLSDAILSASPWQLSGGQKRRVAIAGILAMQPEYLVLDEPTAGLDPFSAKELLDMLKQLQTQQGITIVMVSHSMEEVAEYADRVVVMDQGEIYMDASVWEIFEHAEELEKLGLMVPVGITLLQELIREGICMSTKKCRQGDIFGQLLKLKE